MKADGQILEVRFQRGETYMATNTQANPSMELHVIFGTGVLGRNAARELVRLGKRVRVINRSGKAANLPAERGSG